MQFKDLAEAWLTKLQKRQELGKIKPASLATFTSRVRLHAIPALGTLEVQDMRNGRVKEFAELMALKFSPKSVRENVALVKAVLQSHVNEDGEPILDLSKWNNRFVFENVKDVRNQRRPTINREALNEILANRTLKIPIRVFIALAAATGMRRGELLAARYAGDDQSTTWDKEASAIFVRKSIWGGKEQEPKSKAGIREINVSSSVNKMLSEYVELEKKQPGEYLFCTKGGKPFTPTTVNDRIVKPNGIPGAHSLRRYRAAWLDSVGAPRNFLRELMGHSLAGDVTDLYIGKKDETYRRQWVERIGTGLDLASVTLSIPTRVTRGRKISVVAEAEPIKPVEPSPEPVAQLAAF
jgi:integrase